MRWFPEQHSAADESSYVRDAWLLRGHGPRALAERHLGDPAQEWKPGPQRVLWLALLSLLPPVPRSGAWLSTVAYVATASTLAYVAPEHGAEVGVLMLTSPLGVVVARRCLPDSLAALLVLSSVWVPWPIALALGAAAALMRESAALPLLALAVVDQRPELAGSLALALGAMVIVYGPSRLLALARLAGRQAHSPYSRQHQSGPPWRVLVDMALLSPALVVLSARAWTPPTWILVALAAHALAPLKNARLLLPLDLALRVWLAPQLGSVEFAVLVAVDLAVVARTWRVYDPVTSALVSTFGNSSPR